MLYFSKVGVLLFLKGNVLISPTKYLFFQEVLRVFVCICYPLQHNKISIAKCNIQILHKEHLY